MNKEKELRALYELRRILTDYETINKFMVNQSTISYVNEQIRKLESEQ
jgi:hypothetical protein